MILIKLEVNRSSRFLIGSLLPILLTLSGRSFVVALERNVMSMAPLRHVVIFPLAVALLNPVF